jgi:hypothetical protein
VCTVRYRDNTNTYGCQFQVQSLNNNGFAATNAYIGQMGRPQCQLQSEGALNVPSGWRGTFRMF